MKELKVGSSSADDPTGERADIPNSAADQQTSFQESADPLSRYRSGLASQLLQPPYGPRLVDGYAPESATLAQAPRQEREWQSLTSSRELRPSSHSSGDKKITQPSPTLRAQIEQELASVRAAWQKYRSTNSRDAVYF